MNEATGRGGHRAGQEAVVVVGCGGNIGSHLLPHIARMPVVRGLTLIDRDIYEEKNLRSQDIAPHDIGEPKAVAQARRVRSINPALDVVPIVGAVESVPLGLLRAGIVLACLDSRAARQYVNQAAWRLGVPWIDSGVRGEDLLARVNVYVPQPHQPCLECAWDERDYELLEQSYPCDRAAPQPTNAPSSLGALAASLLAIECEKLLSGGWASAAIGRQVLIDAADHKHYVTRFAYNSTCRFDHTVWQIEMSDRPADKLTVADILDLGGENGVGASLALKLTGDAFVKRLTCAACGQTRDGHLRLLGRLGAAEQQCAACGGQMLATGFDLLEWLHRSNLDAPTLRRPLRSFGLCAGDVLTIAAASGERHLQIGLGTNGLPNRELQTRNREQRYDGQDLRSVPAAAIPGGHGVGCGE